MSKLRASKEMGESLKKLCENWKWLDGNLAAIQEKYAGKWIAISGSQIVNSGSSLQEVKASLTSKSQQAEGLALCVPEEAVSRPM